MIGRPPMPRGRAALAAALAAAALVLGACGGDSQDAASTTSTAATGSTTGSQTTTPTVAVNTADEGGFDAQKIYAEASPSVVTVLSILGDSNVPLADQQAGQGSGFVISNDGEIVTNAHVVTDAEQSGGSGGPIKEASEVYVEFGDRNEVPAEIIGFDPNADVALIKVDPKGLDLKPIELGDSSAVEVGQPVAAIGSPFGEDQSLSTGIVSATGRSIASLTDFRIDDAIQTDASINPGNSGGPLIGADGKVIGIDQQINTTSGGNEGVGFAVPINLAKRSVEQLRSDGEVKYAYIGVRSQPLYPQLADKLGIDAPTGSLISKVTSGGPADEAGLQGAGPSGDSTVEFQGQQVRTGGDTIVAVEGKELVDENDLSTLIAEKKPGDKVTLTIIRDGEKMDVDVTLGERPSS